MKSTMGFNATEAVFLNQADLTKTMQSIAATGAGWVRTGSAWSMLQPASSGSYSWTQLDMIVNTALSAGLKINLLITAPKPSWGGFFGFMAYTPGAGDFGTLMCAVAKRYQPGGPGISAANAGKGVTDYEIWNEQNSAANWNPPTFFLFGGTGPSPSEYVSYLKAAYQGIKAVQPAAKVIFGGLMATATYTQPWGLLTNVSPDDFLTQAYAAGAKGYFDEMNYHPYSGSYTTWLPEEPVSTENAIAKVAVLQQVMAANGDSSKPIRLTEFGFSTAQMSTTQQQQWLAEEMTALQSLSGISNIFIYSLRDTGSDGSVNNSYGMYQYNWTPKPSLTWANGV